MCPLQTFVTRHQACVQGVAYAKQLIAKGIDTPDKAWEYIDLPHQYRLWLFCKVAGLKAFRELTLELCRGQELAWEAMRNDIKALEEDRIPLMKMMIVCTNLCMDLTRHAWVRQYNKLHEHAKYNDTPKDAQRAYGIQLCHEALEAETVRQAAAMFKILPEIPEA